MLHTKFQASGPIGSEEEDFLNIFMYFYGLNLGPPGGGHLSGHLGTLDLHLNKLGKGPLGNVTY